MPIRINLLAEDQAAEEQRRRDPFKRSLWVAGFAIGLVFLWSGWLQVRAMQAARELKQQEAQWAKLEMDYKRVTDDLKKTAELERKLTALRELAANRFLLSGPLHALQQTVLDNVQVVRLKLEQAYVLTEATKGATNGTTVTPGKPATSKERISLSIEAKDFSNPPGEQVNRYRDAIAAFPYFREQLKKVEGVKLTELSQVQSDPTEPGKTFVLFTIQCMYPENLRPR